MIRFLIPVIAVTLLFGACSTVETGYTGSEDHLEIHMVPAGDIVLETGIEFPPDTVEQVGFIAFVRGSGGGDMREYFPGFIDTYLRDLFLNQGFAIIYSNKRGIGASGGNWKRDASFTTMAEDVVSILNYYRDLEYVAAESVGVVGHSQGGWVVQRIAGMDGAVDFAVSLMGPVTNLAEQDIARTRIMYECEGHEGRVLERKLRKRERTYNLWRNVGGWFPYFELGFMHNIVDDSTADDLRSVSVPLLLSYGGSDGIVPVQDNLQRLDELFPEGLPDNISILYADDADHFLTVNDSPCNEYTTIVERPFSTAFHEGYSEWLKTNVFKDIP